MLAIEVKVNNKKISILVAYKPPKISYTELNQFCEIMHHLFINYNHYLCLGDLNVNILKPLECNIKFLNNLINEANGKQRIKIPTRITTTSKALTDVVICTKTLEIIHLGQSSISSISEDNLMYAVLNIINLVKYTEIIQIRNLNQL